MNVGTNQAAFENECCAKPTYSNKSPQGRFQGDIIDGIETFSDRQHGQLTFSGQKKNIEKWFIGTIWSNLISLNVFF